MSEVTHETLFAVADWLVEQGMSGTAVESELRKIANVERRDTWAEELSVRYWDRLAGPNGGTPWSDIRDASKNVVKEAVLDLFAALRERGVEI